MQNPEFIWQFGQWIARRESGAARLGWQDGEIVLRVVEGRVVSTEGFDTTGIAREVNAEPADQVDLLLEATEVSRRGRIPETHALSAAKTIIEDAIAQWMSDPDRALDLVEGEPEGREGPTISLSHAIVELVLSDPEDRVCGYVLPSLDMLVRRSNGFLELYAPLRLSEDADLIVSRITGERTAREVADGTEHGEREVVRLIAALIATGVLEPVPEPLEPVHVDLMPSALPEVEIRQRRLPLSWLIGAASALFILVVVIGVAIVRSGGSDPVSVEGDTGTWGLVVDMGCAPEDLQRILKLANANAKDVRAVRVGSEDAAPCWRLVWGEFQSQASAEQAVADVPDTILRGGFEPHAVELETDPAEVEP
ncbi:MAG: hypothetical protein GY906_36000 [bacterium]|nr:hypothetical protein [bacterium]